MNYEIFSHLNLTKVPETQNDFADFFVKIATITKPNSFEDLREKVASAFENKYDSDFKV